MGNIISFSGDEFYISYLEKRSEMAAMLDVFCHIFGDRPEPKDRPETALVVHDVGKNQFTGNAYYILYGDHRKAYAKLVPDLAACMEYFMQHLDQIAHASDMPEVRQHS